MLNEITLPDGYTGALAEENEILYKINENFFKIENMIQNIPDAQMSFDKHIADFEEYEIDLYFSGNKKIAHLTIEDDVITIKINNNTIKIDSDGNVI